MLKVFNFDSTPIVDIINDTLVDAVKRGASDIHFDSHEKFMRARIRIDGQLINYTDIPEKYVRNLITRIKIISGMNITESRLPQDGSIKSRIKDVDLDLRVSSIPTSCGEKIVLRILDYERSLNGIEILGFNENNYKKVVDMISSPNGIILVTGATGTGKSTTVYSILQRLNKEETNIITIEDPIEMDIDGINQIQTNSEIGLDFATALRSILRQDPNVIMVGEIRDSETAKIAIRAAITGHLVLSTLHTNDSLNTIERLMDMNVEKYLLASALTGIISQRLARKLCTHCRKKRNTTNYEKEIFQRFLHQDVNEIYEAVGCEECNNGYKGRIAIHEVLNITQEIRDALNLNIRKTKLKKLIYNENVQTLIEDGLEKVIEGHTTLEEVLKLIEIDDKDPNEEEKELEAEIEDYEVDHTEKKQSEPTQTEETNIQTDNNNNNQSNDFFNNFNQATEEQPKQEEPVVNQGDNANSFEFAQPEPQQQPEPTNTNITSETQTNSFDFDQPQQQTTEQITNDNTQREELQEEKKTTEDDIYTSF